MITKGKPRGVPFKKGEDTRRHLDGRKSKDALDFKAEFKRVLHDEVNIKKLVRVLLRKAEAGIPWAMQEVLDRGLGKAVQFTDNKFEEGLVTYRILLGGDTIDEETGVVIRRSGYIATSEHIIDGRKPIDEERERIRCLQAGQKPPDARALPAHLSRKGDKGPSARVLEELEAADKRRLLEAHGGDGQGEEGEGGDYIDACKQAGE